MRSMTWHPVSLHQNQPIAHLFLPDQITRIEADVIISAINRLAPPPVPSPQVPTPQRITPTPPPGPSTLARDSRATVDTETAAGYLNRRPQTLRTWACRQNGPIRPIRINGRLAWPVADIRRCVGLQA
jgi:hypothetical protein